MFPTWRRDAGREAPRTVVVGSKTLYESIVLGTQLCHLLNLRLPAPALSPIAVTWSGSPPKPAMFFLIH